MLTRNQITHIKENSSLFSVELGHAHTIYIGSSDEVSYGLFTLRAGKSFWFYYNPKENVELQERYVVLAGSLKVSNPAFEKLVEPGETIDASIIDGLTECYAENETEILIEMSKDEYIKDFFETIAVQRDANAIEKVDGYTYHHCTRIKDYSLKLWTRLNQPVEGASNLRWGAYFHDIGKLKIPLDILNKKGPLTDLEWELMKQHASFGAELIRNHEIDWLHDCAFIVEQHHERYDGKGYPNGLKGDEISIEASIVSIVDAFDAMITNRVYRNALTMEEAIEEMKRGRGTQFHPTVLDEFLHMLEEIDYNWL
ncbi:HD-GYP domain-containing protein [Paenisporosarcina cavernae]|uniref:HD-GYP domain-containing protein n=1 Tax=Paenisporosarcina cavernae TaxID=2320858 RepID=A0A385YVD7_9BACL|nr:HD-GYP domain-containing protein [Paenisporosarcina cavernae]AYC30441.1 HD-GYP domain-containing protein [Paenisporosarcina cavernae]